MLFLALSLKCEKILVTTNYSCMCIGNNIQKPVKTSGAAIQDAGRPAGNLASVVVEFGIASVTKCTITLKWLQ